MDGIHKDQTEWRFENIDRNVVLEAKTNRDAVENAEQKERKDEANVSIIPTKEHCKKCVKAIKKDLKALKEFEVYKEVKFHGKKGCSSRWILTEKSTTAETSEGQTSL